MTLLEMEDFARRRARKRPTQPPPAITTGSGEGEAPFMAPGLFFNAIAMSTVKFQSRSQKCSGMHRVGRWYMYPGFYGRNRIQRLQRIGVIL